MKVHLKCWGGQEEDKTLRCRHRADGPAEQREVREDVHL